MTVQELLKKVDTNEFVQFFMKEDKHFIDILLNPELSAEERENVINKYKTRIIDTLTKTREMKINRDEEYIVFGVFVGDEDTAGYNVFMVNREDIKNSSEEERTETYAMEFESIEDTLGRDVSEACLFMYDEVELACAIFDEMMFFGLDIDERNEEVQEKMDLINESMKELTESDFKSAKPVDEAFKELGWIDSRTELQKEFDLDRVKINVEGNQKLYKRIIRYEKETIEQK